MALRLDDRMTEDLGAECTRIGNLLAAVTRENIAVPPRTDGPIAALADRLGLSLFERDILTFAIAVEINAEIAALAAEVSGAPQANFATFSVAFAAFEDPDWSALSPDKPLRRLRLVDLSLPDRLLATEIRVDERLLHALFGNRSLDQRLRPYLSPVGDQPKPGESLADIARRITKHFEPGNAPGLVVTGRHAGDIRIAVRTAAGSRPLWRLSPAGLPQAAVERETFARLWEREARLTGAILLMEAEGDAEAARIAHFLEGQPGPVIIAGREPPVPDPKLPSIEVPPPLRPEQARLWRRALGVKARHMNGEIDTLTQTFDMSEAEIAAIAAKTQQAQGDTAGILWSACRSSARPRLGHLAQRIETLATWKDLVLPEDALATLRVISAQVRRRHRVHHDWGFATKSNRGLGTTALFAGPSGTGKTMAAEVIAGAMDLDLYRIDLSAVVSKYIGETEKNLRALFDAAEGTGAVLLFDEADALFGKRSEVSDAHDRYANIEVSYLLQRMEAYSGLAVLTTNMRGALDDAFVRRIRFAVNFPFPTYASRLAIWKGVFPTEATLGDLAWDKLARLELSAGHIRNVALNAAFLAAEASRPIGMDHLLRSAMIECANIEKAVTPTEIAGWVS
jgi:hypothetical protein